MGRIGFILAITILAVSTAAPLVRLAFQAAGERGLGFSLAIAASRLTLAALLLVPTAQRSLRNAREGWIYAVGAGICLAGHFALWTTSLAYTSIAASTTLVTTNPVWVTLLGWWWYGERPSRRAIAGIAIALAGSVLIAQTGAGDAAGSQPLLGNTLALMGSWTISIYLLLGREAQRQGASLGGYVAIAYTTAALILLPLPLLLGSSYTGYPLQVYLYLGLMALIPQAIGHTGLNWAVQWISPTAVALTILLEPVAASLLGYWLFDEVPAVSVVAGGGAIVLGVAIALYRSGNMPR